MGVHLRLEIQPEKIAPEDWGRLYRQAHRLWTAWPDALVTIREASLDGNRRWVLSRAIEHDADDPGRRALRVCGDLVSMQTAEVFELRADLTRYRHQRRDAAPPDILDVYLAEGALIAVFAGKTQGHPYHQAVLAVAMLAETRFPDCALVSGDITKAQCEQAARTAEGLIGETLRLPILVDAERLYPRLVGRDPDAASPRAFARAFLGSREDAIRLFLRRAPRELVLDWLVEGLSEVANHGLTLGVISLFQAWMNAGGHLDDLIDAAVLRAAGPHLAPTLVAKGLVAAGASLAPERIDGLDHLDRPATQPPSIASMLGNALLDMSGFTARHCRRRIGAAALIERMQAHFPEQAEACREVIDSQTAILQEQLTDLGRWAADSGRRAEEDVELGDGESFVRRRPGDQLSAWQESCLRELAHTLREHWEELRAGASQRLADSISARRQAVLRIAQQRRLSLTEAGWAWIDAENDPELLDLLLLLLANNTHDAFLVNLRRGLFEHRELCLRLQALILDASTAPAD